MAVTNNAHGAQSKLGQWLETLFDDVFFQPDDERSKAKIEEGFSAQLAVSINGKHLDLATYRAAIADARTKSYVSLKSNVELKMVPGKPAETCEQGLSLVGSVATHSTFTFKDKKTGETSESSAVIIANIANEGGKRVLRELTEVTE